MKKEVLLNNIRSLCVKSMIYEVMASPKPGLVDRFNNGAHEDMDLFTFIDSINSLSSYFYRVAEVGYEFKGSHYRDLMGEIRPLGIEAERSMLAATKGVNTHKGLIFLMGIVASASSNLYRKSKAIKLVSLSEVIQEMTVDITDELSLNKDGDKLTYGERIFKEYGITGIRGEVEEGLPSIIHISYPIFKSLMDDERVSINAAMIHSLLHLMERIDDINILGRHDMDMLSYVRKRARHCLSFGGYLTPRGRKYVQYMDRDFIDKNISPGGSADLLAVTILIYFLERM